MKSFTTISSPLLLALVAALGAACAPDGPLEVTGQGLVVLDPESRPSDPAEVGSTDDGHAHEPDAKAQSGVRSYFHDFGIVEDGKVAHYTYRLKNTDAIPLTITRMSPSCGCTVPSVRYVAEDGQVVEGQPANEPEILVVPPGTVAELDIRIDTGSVKSKNVRKLMQVRITTDSQNDPYLTLECSLVVQQPFTVRGEALSLGRMPRSIGGRSSVEITQSGEAGARLVGVGATPEGVTANLTEEDLVGRSVWKLEVEVEPPLEIGNYAREIELLTETSEGEPGTGLMVKMRGSVVPDMRVAPNRIILADFQAGSDEVASASAEIRTLIPGARFAILGAETSGSVKDFIDVEWLPMDDPDATSSSRWTVTVSARPGIEVERFSGTITLYTDDAQTPEVKLTYAGL